MIWVLEPRWFRFTGSRTSSTGNADIRCSRLHRVILPRCYPPSPDGNSLRMSSCAKISQGDHVSVSSYLPNARSKQRIAEKLKGLGYLVVKNLVELARCLAARW